MFTNKFQEVLIIFTLFIVAGVIRMLYQYSTISVQRITISRLKFGADGGGTHYMIYTKDGQAIRNTNLLFFGKFKSDEIFAKLKVGKTYTVKTCGIRVPWLGWYKNVISITEIKTTNRIKSHKNRK